MNKSDLKKLKKQLLDNKKAEKISEREALIQQVNDNRDQDLFRDAMSGVSPLSNKKTDKAYHEDSKPVAKPIRQQEEICINILDPLSDELEVQELNPEDIISYCSTGIQRSIFRKLRSGNYRISDELDLHGATLKQAKKILVHFLQEAPKFESCCIRIIHGKGHGSGNNKPVLKTHVNHWLTEHERVLAFHSARSIDGGAGAVYVLLRRDSLS